MPSNADLARYSGTFAMPVPLAVACRRRNVAWLIPLFLPAVHEWVLRDPDLDVVRWSALAMADDVAYGAGVWFGSLQARTLAPLLPGIAGRRTPRRRSCGPNRRKRARR
jgi:hypothetical protein